MTVEIFTECCSAFSVVLAAPCVCLCLSAAWLLILQSSQQSTSHCPVVVEPVFPPQTQLQLGSAGNHSLAVVEPVSHPQSHPLVCSAGDHSLAVKPVFHPQSHPLVCSAGDRLLRRACLSFPVSASLVPRLSPRAYILVWRSLTSF